ncbi:hypothetical protein KAR91_09735 [Candidatus Pacearchaeota archaeon]|nr:hypothetical protein [Candidatus Pacearchaeota archaeon]
MILYYLSTFHNKIQIIEGEMKERPKSFVSEFKQVHFYEGRTILKRDLGPVYNVSLEALLTAYIKLQQKNVDTMMSRAADYQDRLLAAVRKLNEERRK